MSDGNILLQPVSAMQLGPEFSGRKGTDRSYRTRPGERVAKRRRCKARVGFQHRITQTETVKWFKNRFDGIVR